MNPGLTGLAGLVVGFFVAWVLRGFLADLDRVAGGKSDRKSRNS